MQIYSDQQKEKLGQGSSEDLLNPRSNINWAILEIKSVGIGLVIAGLFFPFIIHMPKTLSIIFTIAGVLIIIFGLWLSKKNKSEVKDIFNK